MIAIAARREQSTPLPFPGVREVAIRLALQPTQRRDVRRFLGRVNFAVYAAARRGWAFNTTARKDLVWCFGEELRRFRFHHVLARDVLSEAARRLRDAVGPPERPGPDAPFRLSPGVYTISGGCVGLRLGPGWLYCGFDDPSALSGLVVPRGARAVLRAEGDEFHLVVPVVPAPAPVVCDGEPASPVDLARFVFRSDVLMA